MIPILSSSLPPGAESLLTLLPMYNLRLPHVRGLNLRGGFLLKLSVALAAASDAVRLSVLVFLTELLGFCAVHTAAHADVAGAWCGTLTNVALSLESDGAWDVASGVVPAAIVSLIIGFRGASVLSWGLRETTLFVETTTMDVRDTVLEFDMNSVESISFYRFN